MSNRPKRTTAIPDKSVPEEMPDEPLETLPLPEKQNGDEADTVENGKVGYCSPPTSTRWKKGCASPNPFGRPRKQRTGRLTQMMEELVEHSGPERKLTRREALDRILRDMAIKEGGRWLRLLEERKERDQILRQEVAADRQRNGGFKPVDMVAERVRQQARLYDILYRLVLKHFPGVVETECKLLEAGVIVRTGEGYRLTDRGKMLTIAQAPLGHKGRSSKNASKPEP